MFAYPDVVMLSPCLPPDSLPDDLLRGLVTQLPDQVLPHVAQPDQLGVKQVQLKHSQQAADV